MQKPVPPPEHKELIAMFFSDLCRPDIIPENKQRINLSKHAYDTLSHDASVFFPDDFTGVLPSGFINQIIRCFADSAEASIAALLRSRREDYACILAPMAPEPQRGQALELLLEAEKQRLLECRDQRLKEKGHSFSFRINRENLDQFRTAAVQDEAVYYQDNVGAYLKAVLEEYCTLPYVRRELIYYDAEVQCIRTAIALKKRLKLYLRHSHLVTGGGTVYMKPYGLLQDSGKKYNYIVGMLSDSSDSDAFMYASIRLSSVVRCSTMQKSGILSTGERREILRRIRSSGVPYLSSGIHTQIIKVRLTNNGVQMYNSMLHLRPMYSSKYRHNGAWIYEFDCLLWEAEIYFFKFGSDALILEPAELSKKFLKKYQAAAEQYQNLP